MAERIEEANVSSFCRTAISIALRAVADASENRPVSA
jgi:hypothetical protein